ncbi:Tn3 family transposase [Streptomyces sp. ME01-18a]|nr:Tn3 family transposase [Streptomyces sp. ME01-18a]MDX3433942.1 Tn3 family transposase [Streptomyces sp. ME01-18a]
MAREDDAYPGFAVLTCSIPWELMTQHYDHMIKYATAIRTQTASIESCSASLATPPTPPCKAMLEVGRARRPSTSPTTWRCDLQRDIERTLNVMESSGGRLRDSCGKGGKIALNRRDEQEMFVLRLRNLQFALVYVNTLILQDILDEPEWAGLLAPADRRGLTLLFSHVRPYSEVNL